MTTIGHGFTIREYNFPTGKLVERQTTHEGMQYVERSWEPSSPTKPILIALSARAMGSGKSTVAERLMANHGFVLVKFAGPLKAMTRTLLSELGEDAETVERRVEGDRKETVVPALQQTTRHVMQCLGTEFGRVCLHENVWADITRAKVERLLAAGKSVVIDDLRYLNELEALRWIGVVPVRVERHSARVTSTHSSEGELDHEPMITLPNNDTIERLHQATDVLVHSLKTGF